VGPVNDHARGYPNLAAFLDSDEGFAVYRRFGYLQSRLLLQKQEELRVLEEELQAIEKKIQDDDDEALCYHELFGPYATKHRQLLQKIKVTYCSYGTERLQIIPCLVANVGSTNSHRCSTNDVTEQAIWQRVPKRWSISE
jgi:hypothetical protein